jgi:23S rRNA pseudouridine2605 synthase
MRLNKFLAASGVAARRKADQLIVEGRVRVNGEVVATPGVQVDPRKDRVEVDGQAVKGPEPHAYIIVNKPLGHITSVRDPQGRPTVIELVPRAKPRLFPVGRLDADSDGLLFLMNDGRLAFRLTHPRYEVPKTYRARLNRPVKDAELAPLRAGIVLEDGPTAPAGVRLLAGRDPVRVEITIREGRNRQVRRMFEAIGFRVEALRRVRFGPVGLGLLKPGEWREMTQTEIISLRRLTGLLNG